MEQKLKKIAEISQFAKNLKKEVNLALEKAKKLKKEHDLFMQDIKEGKYDTKDIDPE